MIYPKNGYHVYVFIVAMNSHPAPENCPLCKGEWQGWELLFAPHALDDLRAQVMGWIGQLPYPPMVEWIASPKGLRVRLYLPPHVAEGVVQSWAAMTGTAFPMARIGNCGYSGNWICSASLQSPAIPDRLCKGQRSQCLPLAAG